MYTSWYHHTVRLLHCTITCVSHSIPHARATSGLGHLVEGLVHWCYRSLGNVYEVSYCCVVCSNVPPSLQAYGVCKVTMCMVFARSPCASYKSYWSSIPGMRDHMTSKVKELPLQAETLLKQSLWNINTCCVVCMLALYWWKYLLKWRDYVVLMKILMKLKTSTLYWGKYVLLHSDVVFSLNLIGRWSLTKSPTSWQSAICSSWI